MKDFSERLLLIKYDIIVYMIENVVDLLTVFDREGRYA